MVSGCGPLGLGMIAAAKLKCPKLLIAMDLYDWKVCMSITKILCLLFVDLKIPKFEQQNF